MGTNYYYVEMYVKCNDCNWRGAASELNLEQDIKETENTTSITNHERCPNCASENIDPVKYYDKEFTQKYHPPIISSMIPD